MTTQETNEKTLCKDFQTISWEYDPSTDLVTKTRHPTGEDNKAFLEASTNDMAKYHLDMLLDFWEEGFPPPREEIIFFFQTKNMALIVIGDDGDEGFHERCEYLDFSSLQPNYFKEDLKYAQTFRNEKLGLNKT